MKLTKDYVASMLENSKVNSLYGNHALTHLVDDKIADIYKQIKRYSKNISDNICEVNENLPELNIIVGATGAGKTTVAHAMRNSPEFENACSYSQIEYTPSPTQQSYNENNGSINSWVVESILCSQSQREQLIQLRNAGMYVRMFFVVTESPMININRVLKRDILSHTKKCDVNRIWERYYKSIASAIALIPYYNELFILDNSVDEELPKVVLHMKDSKVVFQEAEVSQCVQLFLTSQKHAHE